MNGTGVGLRCKTGPGVGGGAKNIVFRDSAIKNVQDGDQYPFEFTSAYPSSTNDPAPDTGRFKHVFISNISVDTSNKSAIFVSGSSDGPHEDIHFTNVTFNNTPASSISYLKNSSFNNVKFTNVVNNANPWGNILNSTGLAFDSYIAGTPVSQQTTDTSNNRKIDVWDFGGILASGDLYNNNITAGILDSKTTIKNTSFVTTAFGDLSIANPDLKDRMYYYEADGTTVGTNSYGTWGSQKNTYSDGYNSNGAYYCNGTGGSTRRYLTLENVVAGDKISIYGGLSSSGPEKIHFVHAGISVSGTKVTVIPDTSEPQDSMADFASTAARVDFVAKYSGTYQIYVSATAGGKPYFHRVVRTPGVKICGNVNLNGKNISAGYSLNFTNQTTNETTTVSVNADNTFYAVLAPGYRYIATLYGVSNAYTISDSTKVVDISASDIPAGINNISFDIVDNPVATVRGNIIGFAGSYDVSKLQIKLYPPQGSLAPVVSAVVDTTAMTFNAVVQKGLQYTAALSGVNDYEITEGGSININDDATQNITVAKKAVYAATGKFLGLSSTAGITSISFTNVDDGYVYDGTVVDGGYTVSLRNGAYSVKAVCTENYSTIGHVVVNGQNATKDILFTQTSTSPQQIEWVPDLYVGDSSKPYNYNTVKDALDAAVKMNPTSEAQRITIHIAPGLYRAQLKIATPYITLANSDPSRQVKITWYYGIGYNYYSVGSDGFYNGELAFDKYSKNNASNGKWGSTVYLTGSALGFRAENIVFENSFNKYITGEELADGVALGNVAGSTISVERTASLDVTTRPAQERAAAMAIDADNAEFNNCSFISGQDTLYTGGAGTNNSYFKNCFIEGNTDYIFGDGNVVFDDCTLNFSGYSDQTQAGYITAAKDTAAFGYLFRNCTVTANSNNKQAAGYFGRPWGPGARVIFVNTKLQSSSIISPQGWTDMSGAKPENAHFAEYNTTYNGAAVDTSSRRAAVLSDITSIAKVISYFGDWAPKYYKDTIAPVWPVQRSITASSITETGVTLTWSMAADDVGVIGYRILNGSDVIATVAESVYSYDLTGLSSGTGYTFTVQAGDAAGNWSVNGPAVTVKTLITADVDVDPDIINVKSNGKWITVYIELLPGYDASKIDLSTVKMLVNNVEIQPDMSPSNIGDYDMDSIPDLMLKFDRSKIIEALSQNTSDEIIVTVKGKLQTGDVFTGKIKVKVKR
jgi:pectin methylesterase-like acyl-CoA thioesterase